MKKLLSILMIISLVFVALAGCSTDSSAPADKADGGEKKEVRTIRAGIGLPEAHPQYQALLKWKEIVEAKTNGSVKVETYHSGTMGDDRQMTEKLQLGALEVTIPSTAPMVNFVKEFGVFDFPFLFANEEVADYVLDGPVGQELLDKLPAQDLIGLAYWENGFRNLTNSKKEVKSVEDFNGLKIRTMENEIHLAVFKALGANPTPMAFTELFTALQQGTVDGQENPLVTIYNSKFFEVQDYLSMTNHVYSPFVFLMSKKFYDASSDEEKEIFKAAAEEARDYERQLIRDGNAEYRQKLTDAGMTITDISPEVHQQLVEISSPIVDQFAEKVGADVIEKVRNAVKEAEAK